MSFKIQNPKLALLALVFFLFFIYLGCWQLSRAREKQVLLKTYAARTAADFLGVTEIQTQQDIRFFRAKLRGEFDNAHTFLLDNKIQEGKIGYEVYTPFKVRGLAAPILIDRGFVQIGNSRRELPLIPSIPGTITLTGMLNFPPTYVSFGKLSDTENRFPMRVEYINLRELSAVLKENALFPYVLSLDPDHPAAFAIKWQIVTMHPEKHTGYALQWFAFALTLLILFFALNRPRKN